MPSRSYAPQQTFISPDKYPYLEVRTTLESTQPYAEHFHSAFSFGLILEGGTCFTLMGQAHEALKGDIALIALLACITATASLHGKARSYHMAYFDAAWFARTICAPLGIAEAYEITMPVVRVTRRFFSRGLPRWRLFAVVRMMEMRFATLFRQLQSTYCCLANSGEPVGKGAALKRDYHLAAANILLATRGAQTTETNSPSTAEHAPVTFLARRIFCGAKLFARVPALGWLAAQGGVAAALPASGKPVPCYDR